MASLIGQTIAHYKILARIGAGGMGVVYRAEDTKLGRQVALKFLPPYAMDNEEDRVRFVNEAQAAAALDHPNICTIHEINEVDGHHFIAMAFIDGQSLKERIEPGPMPLIEVIEIVAQVAAGLGRAHARGIVHRDIKPANILIAKDGIVKIVDFGLAKSGVSKKVTRTGSTVGTAAYMSPEQARSEPVDQRTDIWSVGVIFYEMLAGVTPFRGDHEAVVIYNILNEDCPPLSKHRPDCPEELQQIVGKALAKNTADRYQTIDAMRGDLRAAAGVLGAVVTGVSSPSRTSIPAAGASKVTPPAKPAPTQKKRWPLYASAAAVLVLSVAAFLYFRSKSEPTTAARAGKADSTGVAGTQGNQSTAPPSGEIPANDTIPTVAVLYMENLGGDQNDDFFAAGITEDIIIGLSNIGRLHVLSRHDVLPLRGQPLSVADMGKKLNADYLLEGSVRRDKQNLRMTVQLHKVADSSTPWVERFDRQATDVFKVQSEIADSVAHAMSVALSPQEEKSLAKTPTTSLEAYDDYIRGRQSLDGRSTEDNAAAEAMFKRAIALDRNYALAQVGLARAYLQRLDWGFDNDPQWRDQGGTLLERAGAIDSTLPELYLGRGLLYQLQGDYARAIRSNRRAVALRPLDHETHYLLATILYSDHQWDEADREFRRASELRPSFPEPYRWRGRMALFSGKPQDAELLFKKSMDLAPDAAHLKSQAAQSYYLTRGDLARAKQLIDSAIALKPGTPTYVGQLGEIELFMRQLPNAIDHLKEAADQSKQARFHFWLGWAYRLSGQYAPSQQSFRTCVRLSKEDLKRDSTDLRIAYQLLSSQCVLGDVKDPEPELRWLSALNPRFEDPSIRAYATAAIYSALGKIDPALEALSRALKFNIYTPAGIAADPRFDALKDDPRFKRLTAGS
ncbi:MAG: protein kinase [candidate division Zixibacteria bacterium]|nr:protein kinase [candidate division Zixibacteria bacterium]